MFWKFVFRDLALLGLCLAIWWLLTGPLAGAHLAVVILCSIVAVVITSLVTYLGHEWGHLTGAVAAGSVVYAPTKLFDPFLFHFDSSKNSGRQFVAMSVGGLIASLVGLVAAIALLPLALWAAKAVVALVVIGVVTTLVREVPEAWRVYRGGALPTGMVYEPYAGQRGC